MRIAALLLGCSLLSHAVAGGAPCPPGIVMPFDPADAGAWNESLAAALARGEVLGIGETEHGTREFHEYLYKLAEQIAAERPIAVGLEIDQAHALALDRYVRGEDVNLDALLAARWWASDFFYDAALRDFLVRARTLNARHPDRIRFSGFDLKQPELALAELQRRLGAEDPTRAGAVRAAGKDLLAVGHFGVLANTAGFTADLTVPLPAAAAGKGLAVTIPIAVAGGSYGEVGFSVTADGRTATAIQSLGTEGARADELHVELAEEDSTAAGALELTIWHRGNGSVRFALPRLDVAGQTPRVLSWGALRPRGAMLPTLQATDYMHEVGKDGSVFVRAPTSFDAARAAADAIAGTVQEGLADPSRGLSAEDRLWLPQIAKLLREEVAWRTLEEPNRDVYLAANARWLAETAFTDRPLLLYAHSIHTNRLEGRMGGLLAAAFPDYRTIALAALGGSHRYWDPADYATFHPGDPIPVHPVAQNPWAVALRPAAPRLPARFDTTREGATCLNVPEELRQKPTASDGRHGRRDAADFIIVFENVAAAEQLGERQSKQ